MELKSTYQSTLLAFTGVVGDLAHNEIKTVDSFCTLSRASRLLVNPLINFLIVLREDIPIGIVTKKHFSGADIKKLSNSEKGNEEVVSIMDPNLITVQKEHPVFDALMYMLKHNIKLLLVMDGKESIGVLSQQDWLSVQVNYPNQIIKKIRSAESVAQIAYYRKESKKVIWDNFEKEENAVSLTNIITVVNDAIGKRVQEIALAEMDRRGKGAPPVNFAWIGMGSEGRKAQTIRTDQDNGIIFENVPAENYDAVKEWFLEYAEIVVSGLHECGFPLCKGNIMATNPELCNSIDIWKETFETIIKKADSKELLDASIYFDFRCIYGKRELSDELWAYLFERMETHKFFLRYFAENILQASRPPIKKWAWKFVAFGVKPDEFDIRREATAPLDAAIRLLALHSGIKETSTLKRLQGILESGNMSKVLANNVHVAFDFILKLRFKLEFTFETQPETSNHMVDTEELSAIELRKLKESLKTIYRLQDYVFSTVTELPVPWSMR